MADTQETIADIIAEMRAREDLDGGDMVDNFDIYSGEYGGWDALMLIKAYADRLDAALKRERGDVPTHGEFAYIDGRVKAKFPNAELVSMERRFVPLANSAEPTKERRNEMRPIDACWVHADPILKHYNHALEKHPYFCDGILSPVEDYNEALANQRSRLAAAKSCGMVAACDLVDCELLEAYAEAANGNTARAVEECYDAIAVLLRTIDVLEGRQKLGKLKRVEADA